MSRGLGLVFLVAFLSLARQVVPIAGREGLAPVVELLAAMRRDFSAARFLYFPTLLHLRATDRVLRALPLLGAFAATSVVVGGPHAPWALLACYALYLSLDVAVVLVYPWDSLLLEAGFFAVFLPATAPLPSLAALAAPAPVLAWFYRLLLFRVLFGFGKQKFLGSTRADTAFLHGFFIRQPLPTPLGWHVHRLPVAVHVALLAGMFVVELVLPFFVFVPGAPSAAFFLAIVVLMVAIQATGNFGHFNLLTVVVALPCLDGATARAFSLHAVHGPAALALHGLVAVHTLGALVCFPLNTWASFTWTTWPWWRRVPAIVRAPIAFYRALAPLRWLHPYGVFPSRSAPAIKMSPVLEVTWDGASWVPLRPAYFPVDERSAPRFVAPHHPRFDQAIVYEATGFHEASALRGLTGRFGPYGHARGSGAVRVMRAVLEGRPCVREFLGGLDASPTPPIAARAHLYMLTAAPADREEGVWWVRRRVGPHLPTVQRGHPVLDAAPPPPELWHPDDFTWVLRSRLGPLLRRAAAGADPHALAANDGLTADDVRLFWDEIVPAIAARDRTDFRALRPLVEELRARHAPDVLDRCERLLGRYAAMLVARCEPALGGLRGLLAANPDLRSHTHLHLVARAWIASGREAFDAVMADPSRLGAHVRPTSPREGVFVGGVFRFESTVHDAQKLRMLAAQVDVDGWPAPSPRAARAATWAKDRARRLWGAFELMPILVEVLEDEGEVEERWPRFRLCPDRTLELVDPDG
ncbi:MAG: lipase maturation factor family protein [Myxococcales bacterium]|nr:lipase maturation factor family protein [Myxococcales bacterium]